MARLRPLSAPWTRKTGATIFELKLPAHATGVPMTYMAKGKQYIVVAVDGRGEPAELVALSEPSESGEGRQRPPE